MFQGQPLAPNIMRRATKRLAWGRQSSALNPIPRMFPNTGSSLEKSFTRESVNIRPTPLSTRRLWPYRASIADLPISAGDAIISSASSQASRSQIESLSRNRVQGLCCVANQCNAASRDRGGVFKRNRETGTFTGFDEFTQTIAEVFM